MKSNLVWILQIKQIPSLNCKILGSYNSSLFCKFRLITSLYVIVLPFLHKPLFIVVLKEASRITSVDSKSVSFVDPSTRSGINHLYIWLFLAWVSSLHVQSNESVVKMGTMVERIGTTIMFHHELEPQWVFPTCFLCFVCSSNCRRCKNL